MLVVFAFCLATGILANMFGTSANVSTGNTLRYTRPLDKVWLDFKKWSLENFPKQWAIRDRALFSMKGEVAACCTPAAVSAFYDSLVPR